LEVGNGEEFAVRAWREQGVRGLPGAYLGREIEPRKTQSNPGFSYVRVALVNDLSTIMTALERLKKILLTRAASMAQSRMIGGVYHPRGRGGAMSDALADARHAMNRLLRMLALRGAGLLLLAAATAALAALASYSSDDASLNNANLRDASNW